jgi:hypothetical protein
MLHIPWRHRQDLTDFWQSADLPAAPSMPVGCIPIVVDVIV